jgi:hypothetical protein
LRNFNDTRLYTSTVSWSTMLMRCCIATPDCGRVSCCGKDQLASSSKYELVHA